MRKFALSLFLFLSLPAFAQSVSVGVTANGTAAVGQLPGTATNDNAAAGKVGEYMSSTISSPGVSLSSGVAADMTNLTLTAGDWDVGCAVIFLTANTTTLAVLAAEIVATTNTISFTVGNYSLNNYAAFTPGVSNNVVNTPIVRKSIAASTTFYCDAYTSFVNNTLSAYGQMHARRVR